MSSSSAPTRRLRRLAHHLPPAAASGAAASAALTGDELPRELSAAFELVSWDEPERAAEKFRAFGFCLLGEALAPNQLQRLRSAAGAVFDEVAEYDSEQTGSRGAGRYGLGSMTSHPEWASTLIDNPRVLPVVDAIWGHSRCELLRCGMNGSFPGSLDQGLHIDLGANAFDDTFTELPIQAMPLFSMTVHYPVVDMCSTNGTIRIVPTSNRWVEPIPSLEDEAAWMRGCEITCPAGTAILKDVRIWHGGCENNASPEANPSLGVGANHARPMPNAQYSAPWFNRPGDNARHLPAATLETLSDRGQQLAQRITLPPGVEAAGYLLDGFRQIPIPEKRAEWGEFLRVSGQLAGTARR